jgi:hypothetical protein
MFHANNGTFSALSSLGAKSVFFTFVLLIEPIQTTSSQTACSIIPPCASMIFLFFASDIVTTAEYAKKFGEFDFLGMSIRPSLLPPPLYPAPLDSCVCCRAKI